MMSTRKDRARDVRWIVSEMCEWVAVVECAPGCEVFRVNRARIQPGGCGKLHVLICIVYV